MKTEKIPFEIYKQIRGSWHGVDPVTKIIPKKKSYKRREKYPPEYCTKLQGDEAMNRDLAITEALMDFLRNYPLETENKKDQLNQAFLHGVAFAATALSEKLDERFQTMVTTEVLIFLSRHL